jgi:hypothetical protein
MRVDGVIFFKLNSLNSCRILVYKSNDPQLKLFMKNHGTSLRLVTPTQVAVSFATWIWYLFTSAAANGAWCQVPHNDIAVMLSHHTLLNYNLYLTYIKQTGVSIRNNYGGS